MSRWWAILPLAVAAGVTIWTGPSWPVIAIAGAGSLLCTIGIAWSTPAPVTVGAIFSIIAYAAALWLRASGVNIVGATVFGLGLLFLLDLSEFSRRFRGAEIAAEVVRGQIAYWLGRAVAITIAVVALTICAFFLSLFVPGSARAVVAGLGAVIAFAAALHAGIGRVKSDG